METTTERPAHKGEQKGTLLTIAFVTIAGTALVTGAEYLFEEPSNTTTTSNNMSIQEPPTKTVGAAFKP